MTSTVANIIVILVLALIVGAAILYIRKHSKKGVKCVGCPYASSCSGGCQHTAQVPAKGVEKKK